jgi:chorismate dehydratase
MNINKIGFVSYINAYPFIIPWKETRGLKGWEAVEAHPSELNALLRKGEIQVGLVSSYEVLENATNYVALPMCIAAKEKVKSVLLISRTDIYKLDNKKIILTTHSASSVNLLQIILEIFIKTKPLYSAGTFKDFESGDFSAYLAIGDEALSLSKSKNNEYFVYDLASLWDDFTNLPFVFALWAVRKDFFETNKEKIFILKKKLEECLENGLKQVDFKVPRILQNSVMDTEECFHYLKCINYYLDENKMISLKKFFEYCVTLGKLMGSFDLRII